MSRSEVRGDAADARARQLAARKRSAFSVISSFGPPQPQSMRFDVLRSRQLPEEALTQQLELLRAR